MVTALDRTRKNTGKGADNVGEVGVDIVPKQFVYPGNHNGVNFLFCLNFLTRVSPIIALIAGN